MNRVIQNAIELNLLRFIAGKTGVAGGYRGAYNSRRVFEQGLVAGGLARAAEVHFWKNRISTKQLPWQEVQVPSLA